MGSRPKRFDVAALRPDEVCEALGELARTVEEIGRQVGLERIMRVWGQDRPARSAENFDADAQHFLASGVQFIDGCTKDLPPGLSKEQRQVRDRCNELAGSMEKVLAKRLDEQPAKTWSFVKVNVSPWINQGEETLSMERPFKRSRTFFAFTSMAAPGRPECPQRSYGRVGANGGCRMQKNRHVPANAGRGAGMGCLHGPRRQ